jgi:glycogen synthase kinase 3 beta
MKNHTTGQVVKTETENGNDIIKTVSGSPPDEAVYHYHTVGVVGNGSFGVVFQAKCLETSETVRPSSWQS